MANMYLIPKGADIQWAPPFDVRDLAIYNAEVARGIVHTPEWKAKMAAEQERFNEWQRSQLAEYALEHTGV